jgi:hypothetical protein
MRESYPRRALIFGLILAAILAPKATLLVALIAALCWAIYWANLVSKQTKPLRHNPFGIGGSKV